MPKKRRSVASQPVRDHQPQPWHQANVFWGCASTFVGVVLAVVAAMQKDLRWLLVIAWPFGCVAVWVFLGVVPKKRLRVVLCATASVVMGASLFVVNTLLKPKPVELTPEQQADFTKILKTGMVVPDYTILSCPDADEAACIYAAAFIKLFQRGGWKVEGPAIERVKLAVPDSSISLVDYGPPLVDPNKPDEGVWTKITPWHQTLKTAFDVVGITPTSKNDPQLPVNKARVYFGSVPKR